MMWEKHMVRIPGPVAAKSKRAPAANKATRKHRKQRTRAISIIHQLAEIALL